MSVGNIVQDVESLGQGVKDEGLDIPNDVLLGIVSARFRSFLRINEKLYPLADPKNIRVYPLTDGSGKLRIMSAFTTMNHDSSTVKPTIETNRARDAFLKQLFGEAKIKLPEGDPLSGNRYAASSAFVTREEILSLVEPKVLLSIMQQCAKEPPKLA